MALAKIKQTNFTSGVADPLLIARDDTTFYYNALQDACNLLIMPQGPAYGRPGHQFVRRQANSFSQLSLGAATVTAPQGGTPANVKDGDSATKLTTANDLGATNGFVVIHVDFGAAVDVNAIDTIDYSLSSGALNDEMCWQFSTDNVAWNLYGTAFNWDVAVRSRRSRNADQTIQARYWQLVRIGTTNIAAKANVTDIKFFQETQALSNARLISFAPRPAEAHMMVVTDGNIDVLVGRMVMGSIHSPHTTAQLPTANWTHSIDTLLIFHKNVWPLKIFRQGAADEFDFRYAPFKNIPSYDYGAGVGGVNEVQHLAVSNLSEGSTFNILLEGRRTAKIARGVGETAAAVATKIQTALRNLDNTSATGITVTFDVSEGYIVTFGGDDGKQPWNEMSVTVLSGDSVWTTKRATEGEYPGEDIMSDGRGWPRHGLFHQSRLHLVGALGVPDAHMMSTTTDYYDFDIDRDDDTKAIMHRAQTDQIGAIYNIVAGQHVSLFANDGEFFYPAEAMKEDNVPKRTSSTGSKEGMRVHEIEGALVHTQGVMDETGDRERATSLREFIYEETIQKYGDNLISKLSSHLIKNPVDDALKKALSTDDADILLQVNADGTGTAYTVLRGDSVNAFMPIATRAGDRLLAVGVDKQRRVYFSVERQINGNTVRYIEMWNKDLLLDCGDIVPVTFENVSASAGGASVFTWTFDSPEDASSIGVRVNGARLMESDYTVDLGTKTVVLGTGAAEGILKGDVIRIARMIDSVSGIDHLEGETIQTVIDGAQGPDVMVDDGTIHLGQFADQEVQYGFDYPVSGKMMPLRVPDGTSLVGEKVRVVNLILELYRTGGIEIRANDREWKAVSLLTMDDSVLDRTVAENLFTGTKEIRGLKGYAVGAPVEFRRPGPTPFTIQAISREVSL